MAKNTQLTNLAVNAEADALARLLDNGYLRLYTGTQPANANTAITDQALLVSLRFAATSAPAATNGVLTANAMTPGTAVATGDATWFRCFKSDGTTVVFDGNVGVSGDNANLTLNTISISTGGLIGASSFVYTIPKATAGY